MSFYQYLLKRAADKWPNVQNAVAQKITKHHVVVLEKKGRRRILNHDALVKHLRSLYTSVVSVEPSALSLAEQFVVAQKTTVLVTPSGAMSYLAAFMRPGAAAVFVGHWDPSKNTSDHLDQVFWRHDFTLTDLYYDVRKDEVTILPPGNITRPGFWDYRDHGSVTVNLKRITDLVASAMMSVDAKLPLH